MSQFTLTEWLQFLDDLKTSQTEFNAATESPIFHVQEEKKIFGFHSDYTDEACWIDGEEGQEYSTALDYFNSLDSAEKHAINAISIEESSDLFPDILAGGQTEILKEYASRQGISIYRTGYRTEWLDVGVFLTRQEADWFMHRKKHDYGKLRVYVKSLYWAPQHKRLIQALLSGEVKYVVKGSKHA